MTDTAGQEQPVTGEAMVFGAEVGVRLREIAEEEERVTKKYDEAVEKVDEKLEAFTAAAHDLFRSCYSVGQAFVTMAEAMTSERRQEEKRKAREAFDQMRDALEEERRRLLAMDPVLDALITMARTHGFHSHAQTVTGALPATLDELKELATRESWCTSFEQLFSNVSNRDSIDFGTFTYTVKVDIDNVPAECYAGDGEVWEATFTLPAYMRPAMYAVYELSDYATAATYRLIDG